MGILARHYQVAQALLEVDTFHFEKVLLDDELRTYQSENHYLISNFQMEKLDKSSILGLQKTCYSPVWKNNTR